MSILDTDELCSINTKFELDDKSNKMGTYMSSETVDCEVEMTKQMVRWLEENTCNELEVSYTFPYEKFVKSFKTRDKALEFIKGRIPLNGKYFTLVKNINEIEIINYKIENMYKQVETYNVIQMEKSHNLIKPVVSLESEYGGVCHVINDDHCYVLVLRQEDDTYKVTPYIFKEAFEVLKNLPSPE